MSISSGMSPGEESTAVSSTAPEGASSEIGSSVTGSRAGLGAAEYARQAEETVIRDEELSGLKRITYAPMEHKGGFSPRWVTQVLQNTMIPYFILHIKQRSF